MKKFSCIVLVCLFVFGVSSSASARGSSCLFENSLAKVVGPNTVGSMIIGGISGGIGYVTSKTFIGLATLGKKVFSSSGPRCPLLPFVRR